MSIKVVRKPARDMRRCISLTSNPKYFENKTLQRSQEKEKINELNEDEEDEEEMLDLTGFYAKRVKINKNIIITASHSQLPNEIKTPFSSKESFTSINDEVYYRSKSKRYNRLIEKNGRENVLLRRIPDKSWHFMRDFVTTVLEWKWKYTLAMFLCGYTLSWFVFAGLCYLVSSSHGDFNYNANTKKYLHEGNGPCVVGVYDFTSMFIYSVETQTTIGFGEKYPSDECPETIFLFIIQIICSIAIEGGMISLIYAKTSRPVRQLTKLKFSDKAVICHRDGKLCLIFRVCDLRDQQSINTKIRVYMIVERPTADGQILNSHAELKLEGNGEQIILWPELVCHVIDESSPLRHLVSAKVLNAAQFELYVTIVGVSPATAQLTEARTSYVPREIFWGQRFVNIINYDILNERHVIDHSNFNTTISVDMKVEVTNTETNV